MKLRIILLLFVLSAVPALSQGSQPWKKQINLDVGLQIPGGDGGEGLNTGWGAAATFYYQLLTRQTFISLSAGYNEFGIDGSNASITVIPLLVGLRYNFALTGFQPYIGAEIGIYMQSLSVSDNTVSVDVSESDAGIAPKVGFRYPLAPGFDFDASLKYHNVFADESFSFIGINVGVAYTID